MKLAIVAPVVNPTLDPAGSPKTSTSHAAATSSATAAAGDSAYSPAFWSQVLVSQSAASAAGTPPPTTNPKKRGDRLGWSIRQRPAEGRPQRRQVGRRPDRPVGQPIEEVVRQVGGPVEQPASVVHAAEGTRVR